MRSVTVQGTVALLQFTLYLITLEPSQYRRQSVKQCRRTVDSHRVHWGLMQLILVAVGLSYHDKCTWYIYVRQWYWSRRSSLLAASGKLIKIYCGVCVTWDSILTDLFSIKHFRKQSLLSRYNAVLFYCMFVYYYYYYYYYIFYFVSTQLTTQLKLLYRLL